MVEGQAAQLSELQSENRKLVESLASYRAMELYNTAIPRGDGIKVILERVSSGVDGARSLALAFSPLTRALFIAASHTPPSIMVATSADSGLDAGKMLKPLLEHAGGRGGGSARLAQGSAPSPEAVEQVVALIQEN
jgi:alanyl-tRNA synthetase